MSTLPSQKLNFVEFLKSEAKGKTPEEKFYDLFFDEVKQLKWLKF